MFPGCPRSVTGQGITTSLAGLKCRRSQPAAFPDPSHPRANKRKHDMTPVPTNALQSLDTFSIEVPSWAYGNSGTRFKVFTTPGTPRDPWEKIADAAQVHAVTGLAAKVSIHIPWDKVED